jgi:hypothetical protein
MIFIHEECHRMSKLRTLAVICLFTALASGNTQAAPSSAHEVQPLVAQTAAGLTTPSTSLQGVDSYTIYYGQPSAAAINTLSAYEMVVIEPRLWSAEQVRALQQRGVKVLGYLSVLEQHATSELLKKAENNDYLLIDGERDFRSQWNSWSMNINSPQYQALLFDDVERQIVAKGCDGIFLDTVGNVDDGIWPDALSDAQRDGVVRFIAELNARYPYLSLLQNWGIGKLKDLTAPYIDGILWEDFTPSVVAKDEWSQNRLAELDKLEAQGLAVFTLKIGISGKQKAAFLALNRAHGYVGQIMRRGYDVL